MHKRNINFHSFTYTSDTTEQIDPLYSHRTTNILESFTCLRMIYLFIVSIGFMILELQNPVDEEERAFPKAIYIYLSTLIEGNKDH